MGGMTKKGNNRMHHRNTKLALLALISLVLTNAQPVQAQSGGNNPGVVPPNEKYLGLTYGEWQARWWQALFAIPTPINPFINFGAFGGVDGVVFLAPSYYKAGSYVVDVTISDGTPLFLAVRSNAESSTIEDWPFNGKNEAELRKSVNLYISTYHKNHKASIDGRPVENIDAYRSDSPLFQFGPLPADNLLGAAEGTTAQSVAAGHYLLLTPLSVGQHKVVVSADLGDSDLSLPLDKLEWINCETVFQITVVTNKQPSITLQPQTQMVGVGDQATFTVTANGTLPLSYQWYFNTTPIPSATAPSLTITNVGPQNIGQYSVVVTNISGKANSTPAALWLSKLKMYAGVNVYGPVGSKVEVQYTTNLDSLPVIWTTLTNVTLRTSPEVIIDFDSADKPKRFYRSLPMP